MTATRHPAPAALRGVLNVNKPGGISSYDVIRRVKPLLDPGRPAIGHAGTLDPLADGVLLLLLGPATRVSRFLLGSDKEYVAELLFGAATDTDDITGSELRRAPVPSLDRAALIQLLGRFAGAIEQIPPRYSALKQNGVPLYRRARRGEEVHPRTRTVTVHELELLDWQPPRARLRALVSAGTYIRALARDIGEAADSAATLAALTRTRSGSFTLDRAVSLDRLDSANLPGLLVPIEDALADLPRFPVSPDQARDLRQGRPIPQPDVPEAEFALAATPDRSFLAIVTSRDGLLRPVRNLYGGEE